jgi:octaprenyl-diphosphate synthase
LVEPELAQVEEELRGYARSDVGPVTEIGRYLLDAGGKRIRPMLLLLTAKAIGAPEAGTVRLGAVVELIHNATLVHDDVIDSADTRRGRASANSRWGNTMTVLAGDWLYMQSFAEALRERNLAVLDTLIEVTQKMVEGELLQLTHLGNAAATREQLLDIAERKTAWLFSGCMKLPAILAGLDDAGGARLGNIGRSLGMAFQLIDDLLDLTSTRQTLGKPVAADLKAGKLTFPVSCVMGNPDAAEKVKTVLRERGFTSVTADEILGAVEAHGGVAETRALAEGYARRAGEWIAELAPSVYRDALASIPGVIVNRPA